MGVFPFQPPSHEAGQGFKNIWQTKIRIIQNCIHVHLIHPVSCYRFCGRLFSYLLIHTSIFSLLCYCSVVYPCSRRKWGVMNIAAVFRDIPKADCWIHMFLCSNSCSDNVIKHFFKKQKKYFGFIKALKYSKALGNKNSEKLGYFFKFSKPSWTEIFRSKQTTCPGRRS